MSDSDDDKPLGQRTVAPPAARPAPVSAPPPPKQSTGAQPGSVPASKPAEHPSKPTLHPKPAQAKRAISDDSDDDLPLASRRPSAGEASVCTAKLACVVLVDLAEVLKLGM